MDFVDFISSLAPEGETFLVVRQKPTLKNGVYQYHADGALKCTWPAYLPSKRGKGAWYGNTASFILDRFQDGRVSASAANCEFVILMVLDDVGTKAKRPPVAPTWIMETSPGSFQWGYVFRIQPPKDEFSAAIKAIADAGYTDPGALNAVRNFRLPGSVNLKPGRDNFESKLVEFHPERDFILEELCDAFGVVPAPADSAYRPIRLSDDGADDVLIWLSETGRLFSMPNPEGWAGVHCPNSDEHSDGNPEGRYLPSMRSFCCYHGHCNDVDSRAFLDWVAAEGGPKHTPGLREELLTMTMNQALSKLKPTDAFPDEAATIVAEVERKELGRVDRAGWYTRFAYIQDDDAYFDLKDRRILSRSTFNATFRHIDCRSIHLNAAGIGKRIEASTCFDENRQDLGAPSLVGVAYAAGDTALVAKDGMVYGNKWIDARITPIKGDVTPWLKHFKTVVPDDIEREHLLNVMSFKMQYPSIKINHAILIAGGHGAGKDTLIAPFIHAVCGPGHRNKSLVSAKTFDSAFNYHAEAEIMVINELRPDDFKDRRALENTLKPIIAAPPEYLPINRKGQHPYDAVNRILVMAFSNFRDAIALPRDDRRWFVTWSYADPMDPTEAERLWAWYKAGGYAAIAAYMLDRDVSSFNPSAAPPMTEAKAIMSEQSMSMAESYILTQINMRQGDFARGVVGAPLQAILDRMSGASGNIKLTMGALIHALAEAQWVDVGRIASRTHATKKQAYCAPELLDLSRSELRDMMEPAAPLITRVK